MRQKRNLNEFEFVEKKQNGKAQEELGKGAFGRVRLAIDKLTDTKVAIKTIPKKILKENASAEHLKREIKLHRKLDHPHIVKLYHSLEDESNVYLVLEYVPMGNLFVYLRKNKTIEEQEAFVYFLQTSLAIDYLHKKGIIHRDLKPENILLDAQGNIKICDFGWSAELQPERRTFCGTLDYMCPEMMNSQNHDHRVDIWAMGILLFEMLHGFAPFNKNRAPQEAVIKAIMNAGSTKLPFNDKISNDAKNLIEALLKVNPQERLSMEEIFSHTWVKKHARSLGINIPEFVYEKGVNETVQSINDVSIHLESMTSKPNSVSNYQSQQLPQQTKLMTSQQQQSVSPSLAPKQIYDPLFQSSIIQQNQNQSVTPPKAQPAKSPNKLTPEQQRQKDELLGIQQPSMQSSSRTNYQMQQIQQTQDMKTSAVGDISLQQSINNSQYQKTSPYQKQDTSPNKQGISPNSRKPIFDDKMAKSQMIINKYTQPQKEDQNMFISQDILNKKGVQEEFKQYLSSEQERKQKENEFRNQQLADIKRREEQLRREEIQQKEEKERQEEQQKLNKQREQERENQRKIMEFEENQRRQRELEKLQKQREHEELLQRQKEQELEKQKKDQELEQIRQDKEEKERVRRDQLRKEQEEREKKYEQQQIQEQRKREDQQLQLKREQEEKQKREQQQWEQEQKERLRREKEEQYNNQKKYNENLYTGKQSQQEKQQPYLQEELQLSRDQQQGRSQRLDKKNADYQQQQKLQELEQKARQEYQQHLVNQSNTSNNSQNAYSKQKRQISDEDLFIGNQQNSFVPKKQQKQVNDEEYELEQKLHTMLVENLQLDLTPTTKTMKHDEQSKLDWDISLIEQQTKQYEPDCSETQGKNPQIMAVSQKESKPSQERSVSPNTRQTRFTPRVTKLEERPTHINNMLDDQLDEWDLSDDPQIKLLNQLLEQPQRPKKEKKSQNQMNTSQQQSQTQSQQQISVSTQPTNKFSFGERKANIRPETVENLEESFRRDRSIRVNTSRDKSRNKITAQNQKSQQQKQQETVQENFEEEDLENLKRSKSSNPDNTYDQKLHQFKKYDCDPYSVNYQNQTQEQYKPRKSRISERQNRTIPQRPLQEMDFFDRLKFAFGCLSRRP